MHHKLPLFVYYSLVWMSIVVMDEWVGWTVSCCQL